MLSALSIALNGIGFGALAVALNGFYSFSVDAVTSGAAFDRYQESTYRVVTASGDRQEFDPTYRLVELDAERVTPAPTTRYTGPTSYRLKNTSKATR